MALLSVNLAILNFLPVPILDGGCWCFSQSSCSSAGLLGPGARDRVVHRAGDRGRADAVRAAQRRGQISVAALMGTDGPILAIETSTPVARVVVVDPRTGARLGGAEAAAQRHSSNLLRLCAEVLEAAALSVPALGAIACGAGPGSFTGLRVGLAVAKGLAMPFGVPLVLVSSLEALALDVLSVTAPGEMLLPCLDAGKGQIFAQLFERRGDRDVAAMTDEWALLPDAVAPRCPAGGAIAYAGTGARYLDVLAAGFGVRGRWVDCAGPTADAVARRAIERLARGETDDLASAVPSYGRAPDITRPKRPGP